MTAKHASRFLLSKVQLNLAANLISGLWVPVLWVVTVPAYIHAMGAETFGLVGLFVTIQGMVALLDMGLNLTLNREFARLGVDPANRGQMRDLMRSMEAAYWLIALLIGLMVVAGTDLIVLRWLRPENLSSEKVREAIHMMALALVFQWPLALYSGGLMGLQRQGTLAIVNIVFFTARYGGVLPVLWFVDSSASTFFGYQAAVGLLHTMAAALLLWRGLPAEGHRPACRWTLLRSQAHFAISVFVMTVLDMLITQLDKIALSRLLTLEEFGYYSVISLAAVSLYRLFGPIFSALYPRFTELHALKDQEELHLLYHRGCQVISVVAFSAAIPAALFSNELLYVWMGNHSIGDSMAKVFSLLVIGTAIRGLAYLPYAMQLACGWLKLSVMANVGGAFVYVPLGLVLSSVYGAFGMGVAWLLFNAVYLLAYTLAMHRRILKGEFLKWYLGDVCAPLFWAALVAGLARWLLPSEMGRYEWGAVLGLVFLATFAAASAGAPLVRMAAVEAVQRYFGHRVRTQ